ncbi:MAG: helix-turn-helix transcriptional regulator [Defluviitaleaceae bacterium]|nr:helix-turn-helix transcriptional regulator [Defluviitaleaceae bacterium]
MKPKNIQSTTAGIGNLPSKDYITEKCAIFGENMRIARKERGFTAEALGKFLGISTAYVGLIERGERCPSLETFLKICDFFGESYEAMFTPRKILSVSERKAQLREAKKDVVSRKKKMVSSMLDSFDAQELDYIIDSIKNFKKFSYTRGADYQESDEVDFEAEDDVRNLV